jgi:hypothetical protein
MGDKKVILKCQKSNNEEIDDSDEDTNIDDLIDKVKQKFPQEDIMIFNAYGRSFYHDRSSKILKKFIKKTSQLDAKQIYGQSFPVLENIQNFTA